MTPAESIFALTADGEGTVNLAKAAEAIVAAVTDLVDNQGAKLTGNQAVLRLSSQPSQTWSTTRAPSSRATRPWSC